MKISTHRIYTKDNLELFGLLYEPESKSDAILIHVHGMAGNFYENKFLDAIAETLTAKGIAFFVFNNRGCEYIKDLYKVESGQRMIVRIGDTFERFEDCLLDIASAVDFAKDEKYTTIHLSGHSLGAPKVAYFAAERGNDLASVIFLSPADMVGLALKEKNFDLEISTAQRMIKEGKGDEIMSAMVWGDSYLSANTYMSLSDKNSKVAIFNLYDSKDPLSVLGRIKSPMHTIMGREDGALVVPIEETMNRIATAAKSSPSVQTKILGNADHGYVGDEQNLADEILRWIRYCASR